jgi:hypothetical protein
MKKLGLILVVALTGCATTDYKMYAESQVKIQQAKSQAESERYKALGAIASSGDATAKVAAVMTLNQLNSQANQGISAPADIGDTIFKWATLFVPMTTQLYGIRANANLGMRQSDNSASTSKSTNDAFVSIASKIQAPTTTTTTNNTATPTVVTTEKVVTVNPTVVTTTTPLVVSPKVVCVAPAVC